jgi:hypothetical protein
MSLGSPSLRRVALTANQSALTFYARLGSAHFSFPPFFSLPLLPLSKLCTQRNPMIRYTVDEISPSRVEGADEAPYEILSKSITG